MEEPLTSTTVDDDDVSIGTSILMQFSDFRLEDHHQLRAVVVGLSHGIIEQNLSPTPAAYLAATCSSLRFLDLEKPRVIDAHLKILSLVIPKVSAAKLMDEIELVSQSLVHVLRWSDSLKESSALSGIKCVSHLLITIRNRIDDWSDNSAAAFSGLYGCLMAFVTHYPFQVRQQLWSCLCDVLRSFQGTMLIEPASEAITGLFKKWFPCGEPIAVGSEGRIVAVPGMFVLDTLVECLFLMSTNYKLAILNDFKILLELRFAVTTMRITDCLHKLCVNNPSPDDVPPQLLLDLLCSLSHSVYKNDSREHNPIFTARLLKIGVAKVYSSNRQICVMKLPIVFNALKGIMGQSRQTNDLGEPVEEHHYSAAYSFKCLIHACIDQSLIKEGVDQILIDANANIDANKSHHPSIIEQVCATIESLLGYQYTAIWDLAFEIVSTMFDKLGEYSSYFMKGTLKSLADMQNLPKKEFPFRKQMHECLGSALVAMGPETFLGLLPLNLEAEDPREVNGWLFPILTKYTIGARLSFFTNSILVMVGMMRNKSQKLRLQGLSSRSTDELVYSLWSLLPSFCNFPSDIVESFKDLEQALCNALLDDPQICGIICTSLQVLIRQNKRTAEEADDLSTNDVGVAEQRALASYTPQVTAENLKVLRQSASQFLSVLSVVFLGTRDYDGNFLQSTIGDFASISNTEVVSMLFKDTMEKLSKVTLVASIADSSTRTRLFDLAVSLLPGLNAGEVDDLFTATKPALQDDEVLIQKKAYKVLSIIFRNYHNFLSWKIEELHRLMIEVLPSCHSSAKQHRLECLHLLVVHVLKTDTEQRRPDIRSPFLAEIIIALKEANKRLRNTAFDILVEIGHACGDEERGGKREHLFKLFDMVAEGLACGTPHMISATIEGLARLAYEFSDLVSTASNLRLSSFLHLPTRSQEIIKANLGFLKVLVAKLPSKVLQVHMKGMVEDLVNCQVYCETPLKAKVKFLLEMLVKKCGLDDIRTVMPEEQMELLGDLQTISEWQEERILGCKSVKARSHMSEASTFRLSDWDHTEIFSDFDEETVDNNADFMDVDKVSGRCGKTSSELKSKSSLRSKSRKNKRSWEKIAALDKKNQLLERVKLELDRTSERGSTVVGRPMAPNSFTRMLAKIAATGAISGAVDVTKKLRIEV